MTYKDFDAALREQKQEPVRFRLGGEEFEVDGVNAGPMLALVRMSEADGAEALTQFDAFLASIIRPEDAKRWRKALDRVPTTTLLEVAQFLIEESTGRPTEQLSDLPEQLPMSGKRSNTGSAESAKQTA